jgi:hypothetical protein
MATHPLLNRDILYVLSESIGLHEIYVLAFSCRDAWRMLVSEKRADLDALIQRKRYEILRRMLWDFLTRLSRTDMVYVSITEDNLWERISRVPECAPDLATYASLLKASNAAFLIDHSKKVTSVRFTGENGHMERPLTDWDCVGILWAVMSRGATVSFFQMKWTGEKFCANVRGALNEAFGCTLAETRDSWWTGGNDPKMVGSMMLISWASMFSETNLAMYSRFYKM